MLENNTLVKITNRSKGSLGYTIPDLGNLRRRFSAGESKFVTTEEIRKLSYIEGGPALISQYLIIDNNELLNELFGEQEQEYYYDENKVLDMLKNASLDEFLDMLDFAPVGVRDLIQKKAVEIKLDSEAKRKAILDITGFNVSKAIEIADELHPEKVAETKTRRTTRETAKPAED